MVVAHDKIRMALSLREELEQSPQGQYLLSIARADNERDKKYGVMHYAMCVVPESHLRMVQSIYFHPKRNDGVIIKGWGSAAEAVADGRSIVLFKDAGRFTLIHEIGHVVDNALPQMQDLVVRKVLRIIFDDCARTNSGFPTQYAKQSLAEFFAECYAIWLADPDRLMRKNNRMYQYFERYVGHA